IVGRPLEKLKLPDEDRLQPLAFGHFRFRETLSPPPALRFRQVDERAFRDLEAFEFPEQLRSRRGRKAAACPRDVDQILPVVVPKNQRIECIRSTRVAADDELL